MSYADFVNKLYEQVDIKATKQCNYPKHSLTCLPNIDPSLEFNSCLHVSSADFHMPLTLKFKHGHAKRSNNLSKCIYRAIPDHRIPRGSIHVPRDILELEGWSNRYDRNSTDFLEYNKPIPSISAITFRISIIDTNTEFAKHVQMVDVINKSAKQLSGHCSSSSNKASMLSDKVPYYLLDKYPTIYDDQLIFYLRHHHLGNADVWFRNRTSIIFYLGYMLHIKVESIGDDDRDIITCGQIRNLTDLTIDITADRDQRIILRSGVNKELTIEDFRKLGVGGQHKPLQEFVRRVVSTRRLDAVTLEKNKITHVKGAIFYGPPGTGKTLIAKNIGKLLNCRQVTIVNGPEVLNQWLGNSEQNVRNLFQPAIDDYTNNKQDSGLYLIIFDEFDSIASKRSNSSDPGTSARNSIVNQLLACMDGLKEINNVLCIGLTNRLDAIDDALLRPGRFEILLQISLPDEDDRKDILTIHLGKQANLLGNNTIEELARLTVNYTGAELHGLVRNAQSMAMTRLNKAKEKDIYLHREDLLKAFDESHPVYGSKDYLKLTFKIGGLSLAQSPIVVPNSVKQLWNIAILSSDANATPTSSEYGAHLAHSLQVPFVRGVFRDQLIKFGNNQQQKTDFLLRVYEDAACSKDSVVYYEHLDATLEYFHYQTQYNMTTALLLKESFLQQPSPGHRLVNIVCASTNLFATLPDLFETFQIVYCNGEIVVK